jgi:hypothetical protein
MLKNTTSATIKYLDLIVRSESSPLIVVLVLEYRKEIKCRRCTLCVVVFVVGKVKNKEAAQEKTASLYPRKARDFLYQNTTATCFLIISLEQQHN